MSIKNFRTEILKAKREARKKALGRDAADSAGLRVYGEATKTRRAVKTELFGNKSKDADTSIEVFVENVLSEHGLKFVKQKAVRWCNFDFYLPDLNVLIECQGDYWHCNYMIYPNGPKNNIQRKNIEKNKMKQDIAFSQSIPLIEIWENEIKKYPEQTKQGLERLLGVV